MDVCYERIERSSSEKLLGIDIKPKCEDYVETLSKKRKFILDSFIISHFSYLPIAWMFHSRRLLVRK